MALVQLADVYVPHLYDSYDAVNTPELTAFFESGVAVTDEALLAKFDGGGTLVDLPFWKDLDSSIEPDYITDSPTDIAVPGKIATGLMVARVAHMHKSYSAANLTRELAGDDPLQRIRNRFGTYWQRRWQRRLIDTSLGVMNQNVSVNGGDMVINVALETTVGQSSANLISGGSAIDALFTAGDQSQIFTAIAMHSIVEKNLVKQDMIQYFKPSENSPTIATYLGKRVVVDDGLPVIAGTTSGFKYVSILYGAGAIGYAFDDTATIAPSYLKVEDTQGNGGGVQIIGERKRLIMHPFGYKWNEATVSAQSPTNANLKVVGNWTRQVDRKQVPMAFLVTNG